MPNIDLIEVPPYTEHLAYHHIADQLPITALSAQISLINDRVDVLNQDIANSIGTQGTLDNRLDQSINDDGTLKTIAIDNALHSIAEHLDANGYVRMTFGERSKLSFIAEDATKFILEVETISGIQTMTNQTVTLEPSESITWRVAGSTLAADTNFPPSVRHLHYYTVVPAHFNIVVPDYKTFLTSPIATPYREGSLSVYVNGIRLNKTSTTFVPIGLPGPLSWIALSYSEDSATSGTVTTGKFTLNIPIPSAASIIIDFDVLFS